MAVTFETLNDNYLPGKRRRMLNAGRSIGQGFGVIALAMAIAGVVLAGMSAGIAAAVVQSASHALR